MIDAGAVHSRAEEVLERIDAHACGRRVTVVAVTKGFGPDAVEAAADAGLTDLGESRAQELETKAASAPEGVRWHFVGRLQRNKVRGLAGKVSLWQSVDRAELAEELARRVPGACALVQVNVSGTAGQGGCPPKEAPELVGRLVDLGVDVSGLMAIGAAGPPEQARPGFRALAELADHLELPVRSMGMSGDLEVAVEEGSTMVRLGRALFGPRPTPAGTRPPLNYRRT